MSHHRLKALPALAIAILLVTGCSSNGNAGGNGTSMPPETVGNYMKITTEQAYKLAKDGDDSTVRSTQTDNADAFLDEIKSGAEGVPGSLFPSVEFKNGDAVTIDKIQFYSREAADGAYTGLGNVITLKVPDSDNDSATATSFRENAGKTLGVPATHNAIVSSSDGHTMLALIDDKLIAADSLDAQFTKAVTAGAEKLLAK